jgi:putative endonuclease
LIAVIQTAQAANLPSGWACYLLLCEDDSYYCGMTRNLPSRLQHHGSGKGSQYTKATRPVALVWYEQMQNRQQAAARERQIKRWNHDKKKGLHDGSIVVGTSARAVWVSLG